MILSHPTKAIEYNFLVTRDTEGFPFKVNAQAGESIQADGDRVDVVSYVHARSLEYG